jgi:hypothetical protein
LKPKYLYNGQNKDEYQKFDLGIFRNHFYKVRTSLKAGVFWQHKQNGKGRQQHKQVVVEERKKE